MQLPRERPPKGRWPGCFAFGAVPSEIDHERTRGSPDAKAPWGDPALDQGPIASLAGARLVSADNACLPRRLEMIQKRVAGVVAFALLLVAARGVLFAQEGAP